LVYDALSRKAQSPVTIILYKGELKKPKTDASVDKLKLHPSIASLLLAHREKSSFWSDVDFIFCQAGAQPMSYPICL
jgi:integrase